jgi:hypothetical protein
LTEAGPDGNFNTADDVTVTNGALQFRADVQGAFMNFTSGLLPGHYHGQVTTAITDLAGNRLAGSMVWAFHVFNVADDRDGDGMPDLVEVILGLNPDNPDTDGDGLLDGEEDNDNDGLSNAVEVLLGTNPTNPDTDDDGIRDGDEDNDGDGLRDGEEVVLGTDPFIFDSRTFTPPLDPDGDNIYHFTTITIPSGVTVRLGADVLGSAPLVWLASGAVQIAGTLDLSGQNGHTEALPHIPSIAGVGGFGGGVGATSITPVRPGNGPGGGTGGATTNSGGGGGGHAVAGGNNTSTNIGGGPAYGNDFLLPLLGGSGGGGGGPSNQTTAGGGGGGAGGGAMLIASSTSISVTGAINAKGGNGGTSVNNVSGGGGGSGGAIRLMAPIISGTGTLKADGGTRGSSAGNGSHGRIRLEAFQQNFTGIVSPPPFFVRPGLIFLPDDAPAVRVVSIGGVPVPANPAGSFVTPDVTINAPTAVTLAIEARFIPLGTVLHLKLIPETGSAIDVDSTPLAGTLEQSTATATATFPHGFTLVFVQASWTP